MDNFGVDVHVRDKNFKPLCLNSRYSFSSLSISYAKLRDLNRSKAGFEVNPRRSIATLHCRGIVQSNPVLLTSHSAPLRCQNRPEGRARISPSFQSTLKVLKQCRPSPACFPSGFLRYESGGFQYPLTVCKHLSLKESGIPLGAPHLDECFLTFS